MTTVFIAGSISIRQLAPKVQERIMNIVRQDFEIVVGDADGVDTLIQQFLQDLKYPRVTLFCTGNAPRNKLGNWPVQPVASRHAPGSRAYFTAKDLAMAEAADSGLMIWDARSSGTLSNVIELLDRKKYCWTFVDTQQVFHAVKGAAALEALIGYMTPSARRQAEARIGLGKKMAALSSREQQMSLLREDVHTAQSSYAPA